MQWRSKQKLLCDFYSVLNYCTYKHSAKVCCTLVNTSDFIARMSNNINRAGTFDGPVGLFTPACNFGFVEHFKNKILLSTQI